MYCLTSFVNTKMLGFICVFVFMNMKFIQVKKKKKERNIQLKVLIYAICYQS